MKRIFLLLCSLAFIAFYSCKSSNKDAQDKTDSVDVKSMIQEAYDSIKQTPSEAVDTSAHQMDNAADSSARKM